MSLYFVKQYYDKNEYDSITDWILDELQGYIGVEPTVSNNKYLIYVQSNIVDLFIFSGTNKGFYSASHLCLDQNSCIVEAFNFIDSLKKDAMKNQTQLALF